MKIDSLDVFGLKTGKLTYDGFLDYVTLAISSGRKVAVAYANADTMNKIYGNRDLLRIYRTFDLIHPDGIGIFLASRLLNKNDALPQRITGSDFYARLIEEGERRNWSFFFFGHTDEILGRIPVVHPGLNVVGLQEGYTFDNEAVITKINQSAPDILIIGLSCPKQERWMFANKDKLNCRVLLAVGDGVRSFAGNKLRGPVVLQRIGLEWFLRYLSHPVRYFSKYVVGTPLFMARIIKQKIRTG
jgi:N-acetylglucosaminyldiphosphoundecaprenol N-acetyl-beta-D-mannosaminyltransferase